MIQRSALPITSRNLNSEVFEGESKRISFGIQNMCRDILDKGLTPEQKQKLKELEECSVKNRIDIYNQKQKK